MTVGTPDWRGIPAVDRMSQVLSVTSYTLSSGSNYTTSVLSIREFQSLQVYFSEDAGSYTGALPRAIDFYFSLDSAGTYRCGQYTYKPGCVGGKLYGQIPALGPYVNIVVEGVATGFDSTIDLIVYASHRPLSRPKMFVGNNIAPTFTEKLAPAAGWAQYQATVSASGTAVAYPSYHIGWAAFYVQVSPIATTVSEIALNSLVSGVRASGIDLPISTVGASYRWETYLTGEAFNATFINRSSASVTCSFAIEQGGAVS